jgi:hypothetical protein
MLSFSILYWDFIKFPYFEDREWKEAQRQGEDRVTVGINLLCPYYYSFQLFNPLDWTLRVKSWGTATLCWQIVIYSTCNSFSPNNMQMLCAFIFHLLRRIVMGCDELLSFHLIFISSLPNGNRHQEPWRKTT